MKLLWLSLVLVGGCAVPHRSAITTREIRRYAGRSDGLVSVEIWKDTEKGGGWFLLSTSEVQALSAVHTNQTTLGGGSYFSAGPLSIKVDPQTGAIVEATGAAVGNVIGEAIKTSVKP